MQHLRRISPSSAIAVAALVLAMSGTALAASAVITSSDQVAADVIDGHHVKQQSLSKDDLEDVYLRVRVDPSGNVIGEGNDGTAIREQLATYRVTFSSEALDGSGPRRPRDLSNCAVTATPTMTGMENVPYQPPRGARTGHAHRHEKDASRTEQHPTAGPQQRARAVPQAARLQGHFDWMGKDSAFDVIVVC